MRRALVVVHDPSVAGSVERVVSLAGGPGTADVGVLHLPDVDIGSDGEYVGVRTDVRYHVVHLVPDSATSVEGDRQRVAAVWAGLLGGIRAVHHELTVRLPALSPVVSHWVVTTLGPGIDPVELEVLGELHRGEADVPVGALISVTPAMGTVALTDAMRQRGMGDIAYSLIRSTLGEVLEQARQRAVHASVSSVVFRPRRALEAVTVALRDPIRHLLASVDPLHSPRPAGVARATALLAVGDDGMPGVVVGLTGGSPSVDMLLRAEFQRIEDEVDHFDPGAWAGLLSYELDRLTVMSGEADGPPSILATALAQIEGTRLRKTDDLEKQLREAAAAFMDKAPSLSAVEAWCDGVESELIDRHAKVQALPVLASEAHMTVAEHGERLRKAAQWLPAGNSLLPRALLIVTMSLIGAYTFAFVPRLIATLFEARLPFLGEELETNSQLWARITAGTVGLLIGFGWLDKWRRAKRWRRRWLASARVLVAARVDDAVREEGLRLIEHLIAVIGTAQRPGSLRGWLATAREDLLAVQALVDPATDDPLEEAGSGFALVLPTAQDMERFRDLVPLGEQEALTTMFRDRLNMAFRQARRYADIVAAESLLPLETALPTSLLAYYDQHDEYLRLSRQVLDARLLPLSDMSAPGSLDVMRCMVGDPEVLVRLGRSGWQQPSPLQQTIADPNFVCSIWFRRIIPEVAP